MLTRQKHAKILKIAVYLFIATTAIFLSANFVLAAANSDLGLSYAAGTGLSNDLDIRIIIAKIIRIALGFLGIIALSLIIYAGFLWMTSAGNEEKIAQAKKILTNAVIGLIIILSAFAIASFVLNMLTGAAGDGQNGGPNGGQPVNYGLSAIGNGIIESHYPARDQKEVPRNTSIIISFREPMLASTLCATEAATPDKCLGGEINQKVIRIFKKSDEEVCAGAEPSPDCVPLLVGAKVYSSPDGKTFVFAPNSFLGSSLEYVDYTVYLNSGLKRQSGEDAFPGIEKNYGWSFEVSNKIDLTPPQVKKNEIFPAPDGFKDKTEPMNAARATGKITVNSRPSIDGKAIVANPVTIHVEISRDCQRDGNFSVAIADGPVASLYTVDAQDNTINLGQGVFGLKDGKKQVVFTECNLAVTLNDVAANFEVGNLWRLTFRKATTADTLAVGETTYVAGIVEGGVIFRVWPSEIDTAQSIVNVLNGNPNSEVTASRDGNIVTITAKVAGAVGNSLNLSSSNSTALEIRPMAGGADKEDRVTVNGRRDQPMNAAIQINFNEAIMPLTVSGSSDEVKDFIKVVNADPAAKPTAANPGDLSCKVDADCKSFKCQKGDSACEQGETGCACVGTNDYLKGRFAVSNQYSTVDFLSDKECGFNACGEKIYCLPANSNLRVELNAADLISCAGEQGDSLCRDKSPFNICDADRKFCRDSTKKYYPQADKTNPNNKNIVDGITDLAFNSLDGNRDGSAYGSASYYNENMPENTDAEKSAKAARGDSYQWSFFISDKLDLTPPKIKTPTIPEKDQANIDLAEAVKISFDKLMLSSRLTTGSLTIKNGQQNILHYLLNLRSFIDQPLGYWVTNAGRTNGGGEMVSTDVYINHSPFNKASTYKAQAGSGLKDIYQNCYLPCAADSGACAGVTDQLPCCCNGALGASCP